MTMTSRERVRRAINHQVSDRVPIDMGSTAISTIHVIALDKLRKYMQLEERLPKALDPLLWIGDVEADMRDALQIDCVGVWGPNNALGLENTDYKRMKLNDGTEVLVCGGFTYTIGENGAMYAYALGDTSYPASAKMPAGSYYFDPIPRGEDIDEKEDWDARKDYEGTYNLFTDKELRHIENVANDLYHNTQCSLVGSYGNAGFGDAFHIPAPWLKETPKGIRSVEDWLIAIYESPEYLQELYDMQAEIAIENLKLYKQAVGDKIDVIAMSGTDFAHQSGLLISRDAYREIFLPYSRRVTDWVHQNTNWKTFMHSCGAVADMIPEFIEAGYDILNPVQVSATGMDAETIKAKYGKDIVFWGGGCNPQGTVNLKTPEEVYAETKRNAEILSRGGGYVGGNVHNVQYDVPPENLIAELQALKDTVPQA